MHEGILNVIGKGAKIEGKMHISGSIRVDGEVIGDIIVSELFVLGKGGVIKGNIKTHNATISGKIEGTLIAEDKVELLNGTSLDGDITCKKLVVEEGVILDGNIKMREKKVAQKA